jgi:hypothetical protein
MFIFLKTDGFSKVSANIRPGGPGLPKGQAVGTNDVRRPYRGIEIKDDTYAVLTIRRSDGSPIPMYSSSARPSGDDEPSDPAAVADYSDFILQSVQEEREEKQQIVETFGDTFVYFFGERPRIITLNGLLMNTYDFNWRSQFWRNYDLYMRGTKLVEANARAYLSYDTRVLEGYPLSASATDDSEMPYAIPFSMTMLLTNYYDYSNIGTTRTRNQPEDLGAINQKLEQERSKFTSTSLSVRTQNLLAQPEGGIFGALRSGIRTVNEVTSLVGSGFDKIGGVLGGRVVRVPIGVAGYLSYTGAATFAAGSSDPLISDALDARTGGLSTITGSVKVRAPSNALYAPIGDWKGHYWENYDENPFGETTWGDGQRPPLEELMDQKSYAAYQQRIAARLTNKEAVERKLGIWNNEAEAGSFLDTVADVVKFAKSTTGMVMTGKAFVSDPLGFSSAWLGFPPTIKRPSQAGVSITAGSPRKQHIGSKAQNTTFDLTAQGYTDDVIALLTADSDTAEGPVDIGDLYNRGEYSATNSSIERSEGLLESEEDVDYEAVYGDRDYTALVSSDPVAKASLDEVYGNNDRAPEGSDLDPEVFDSVYGQSAGETTSASTDEMLRELRAAQEATATPRSEDTTGIRSAADDDAQIDPVI